MKTILNRGIHQVRKRASTLNKIRCWEFRISHAGRIRMQIVGTMVKMTFDAAKDHTPRGFVVPGNVGAEL